MLYVWIILAKLNIKYFTSPPFTAERRPFPKSVIHPALGNPHLSSASLILQFVGPSCHRASYTTFAKSQSPLYHLPAPATISSPGDMAGPLPLQRAHSLCNIIYVAIPVLCWIFSLRIFSTRETPSIARWATLNSWTSPMVSVFVSPPYVFIGRTHWLKALVFNKRSCWAFARITISSAIHKYVSPCLTLRCHWIGLVLCSRTWTVIVTPSYRHLSI